MKYDLSILIPARNEQFLARTVKDILEHKEGRTEIIVGMDGEWSTPGVEDHPDVTIVYYPKSIGQRAITNQMCRLSKAKYIIKTDGHCSFDQGFDVKLMEDMQDDWTVVPTLTNLHAFDWVCDKCKHRSFQGPTPKSCPNCDNKDKFTKDMIWKPNPQRPKSSAFTFDSTLHFQYFREYNKRPEGQGDITESMSLQGSFFMLTREKYWELNICDEAHGSWGQQGVEVALKTWLTGGKVMCNRKTWYSHMFRTQGGDFGFPYPMNNGAVNAAREYSRDIWFNNKYPKQIYPLSWLIERFKPLEVMYKDRSEVTYGWHHPKAKPMLDRINKAGEEFYARKGQTKGIIYFTDNRLNMKIARQVRHQIRKAGLPIVSSSLKPMDFGTNVHLPLERGYLTMFKQILAALKASTADIIFFCEHDVLYPREHFDFIPPRKDTFYYDVNVWKLRMPDGMALWVNNCRQVSGIAVYRETAIKHYEERVAYVEQNGYNRNMGFEPGTHKRVAWGTQFFSDSWMSPRPMIDIRHQQNLTPNRWSPDEFRDKRNAQGWRETYDIPGWGSSKKIVEMLTK